LGFLTWPHTERDKKESVAGAQNPLKDRRPPSSVFSLSSATLRRDLKLQSDSHRYRRKLSHLQLSSTFFVNFSTYKEWVLPEEARSSVVQDIGQRWNRTTASPHSWRYQERIGTQHHKALQRSGRVWMNESFDRMPRFGDFERHYEYIIMNPVRAGLVTNPDDYQWLWYQ
jgi:hypothetical protein